MSFKRNEQNAKSQGGSELMAERLFSYLPTELTDQFQFTLSRVRELEEDKYRIYWVHDLPWDPELQHLKESSSIARFHKIVFCGNWQYNQFQNVLNIPFSPDISVINTGIIPLQPIAKDINTIRLIYTSTPQRGLEILIPVFEELCKHFPNIHLDVFSSFKIYGWEQRDADYEILYDRCRNHPNITYHGFQSNDVVRSYVEKAHILAYPSIWMECNSQSIAEAMSGGAMVVAPNYGGIVEGTGNLAMTYTFLEDKNAHANLFFQMMVHAIRTVNTEEMQNYLQLVKMYADHRYHINNISKIWENLLESVVATAPSKSLAPIRATSNYFEYKP